MPHEFEVAAITQRAPMFDPGCPRWADWVAQARRMDEIAGRYNRAVVARMRSIARQAGLDPVCPSLHAHNAMCSLQNGDPWRGVDYSLVRQVLRLDRDVQWRARDVVRRWSERTYPAAVEAHRATSWVA